jgi:hypothetical protein
LIGTRQLYPAISMVPVWTYGPRYDFITGREIGKGWGSTPYITVEVGTSMDTAVRAALPPTELQRLEKALA